MSTTPSQPEPPSPDTTHDPAERPLWSTWLLGGLFTAVFLILAVEAVVVALLMGYAALIVRESRQVPVPQPVHRLETVTRAEPVVGAGEPATLDDLELDVWDQHGPLTLMLLGLDHDTCEGSDDPYRRADTVILVRIDPVAARASMLTLPRDLFVHVEGIGRYGGGKKLAMAHYLGDLIEYEPGAGPGLMKEVVRTNLDIPVHRYARIDFEGFQRIIDAVGPLTIDVPPDPDDPTIGLRDTRYPDGACGVVTIEFPPGEQEMDGEQALQYARSRYSTSDFDRSRRQSEVLDALRARASSVGTLLDLPRLIPALLDTVDTDLTAVEILSLARVARRMDSDAVVRLALDENYVYDDQLFVDNHPQWILRHFPGPWSLLRERFLRIEPEPPTAEPSPAASGAVAP